MVGVHVANDLVAAIAEKLRRLERNRSAWTSDGMTAFLYTNAHTPTAYDTLADYSPCAVDGITGIAVVWPTPAADQGDGTAKLIATFLSFQPTGTSTQQDVIGYFCVRDSDGTFQFAEEFTEPVLNFGSDLEPIVVSPQYSSEDVP
jgi:hypothetical protein